MIDLPGLSGIERPVILAPMEGITDHTFRRICLDAGADAGISEFIAAEALVRLVEKSFRKMEPAHGHEIRWVQIFGNNPDAVSRAAIIAEENGADIIDLNFGCPVKKIVHKGNGAALLKNLPLMQQIATATVAAVSVPVTAKTRLGWDFNSLVATEAALRLQDAGIRLLTLHGRTRSQQYGGVADWNAIAEVKNNQALSIPLIGNGDIDCAEKAINVFDRCGVDGIMIGRASIGNPWLFAQIKMALQGKKVILPTLAQKIEVCKKHLSDSIVQKGEKRGVLEMRKHFVHYFRGIPDFKPYKLALLKAVCSEEIEVILNQIETSYNAH